MTDFSAQLSALLRDLPDLSTPADQRADWFDRKAALLDGVAVTVPDAVELAEAARGHAARLRAGWSA